MGKRVVIYPEEVLEGAPICNVIVQCATSN